MYVCFFNYSNTIVLFQSQKATLKLKKTPLDVVLCTFQILIDSMLLIIAKYVNGR